MKFSSEKEMSILFENFVTTSFENKNIDLIEGFNGLFGVPDYILIEKKNSSINYIISIELKLRNWKRALKQAFRYRSFSNESIVVIDEKYVHSALNKIDFFLQSNIGLASFNKNKELKIYLYPQKSMPFSEIFNDKIIKHLSHETDIALNLKNRKHNKLSSRLTTYCV